MQPLAPLIALLSTIQSLKPEGNDGVSDLPINRYQLVKNMRTRAPSYMEDDSGTVDSLITLKAINNNSRALMKCVVISLTIQFKGHLQKKATVNYESLNLTML